MARIPRRLLYYALTGSCEKPPMFAPVPLDPQVGDWVEWRHQWSTLRGTVRFLVPAGVESKTFKPEGVPILRWRSSWDVVTFPRVVVEVESSNDNQSIFYTVRPDPLNRFRVLRPSCVCSEKEAVKIELVEPSTEDKSTPFYRVHHIENRVKAPSLGEVIGEAMDLETAKQQARHYANTYCSKEDTTSEWMQFLPGVWCNGFEVVGYMKFNEKVGAAIVIVG